MRFWLLAALPLVAAVWQTALAPFAQLGTLAPGLIVPVVVALGLLFGWPWGLGSGAFAGLALDLFLGRFIGLHALAYSLVGLVCGWAEPRIYKENGLLPWVTGMLASLLAESVILLGLLSLGRPLNWQALLLGHVLPGALLSGLLATAIYLTLWRYYTYFRPDPRGTVVLRR